MNQLQIATANWHPKMSAFLFGERNKQFFFRPDTLNISLQRSLQFLYNLQLQNKNILFVTTRTRLEPLVQQTAKQLNQKYLAGKWVGGQFTNQRHRPDCIVLLDPTNDILREASAIKIPVISLFDSNSSTIDTRTSSTKILDSQWIHYPIPGPNTSFRFVYHFLNLIVKTLSVQKGNL
jgi:ribosomal protein S2